MSVSALTVMKVAHVGVVEIWRSVGHSELLPSDPFRKTMSVIAPVNTAFYLRESRHCKHGLFYVIRQGQERRRGEGAEKLRQSGKKRPRRPYTGWMSIAMINWHQHVRNNDIYDKMILENIGMALSRYNYCWKNKTDNNLCTMFL